MLKPCNYLIKTYGCQMNVHESEKLKGILEERGFKPTQNPEDADIIVFNTCCIRESAEQKITAHIGAVKPLKKLKPDLIVAICGCMTQQDNAAENLKKKFPWISIIFGANNLEYFGEYLDNYLNQRKFRAIIVKDKQYTENPMGVKMSRDSTMHAYVNIMYGCNNFCTYCIVPYVKGREYSRSAQDVIEEVQSLVNTGYKIITLLGQNVNSYGNDISGGMSFPALLNKLANIPGDFELRFMTSHPKDMSDELIHVIAQNPKISKSIHLPVQAGSNKILKAMNRNYTREQYLDLVGRIRKNIPDAVLSTDIIVGFPGETDEDYRDTVDLVKKVKYANAFIFMYSKRKGTAAEAMPDQVKIETKRARIHELQALQHEISEEVFRDMVGRETKVFTESETDNCYIAHMQCGKTVKITKSNATEATVGEFVNVTPVSYKNGNFIV